MTKNTETNTEDQAEQPQHTSTGPEGTPTGDTRAAEPTTEHQDTQEPQTPNSEAAKYRVRLRETEAERDQLREQLQQLQDETVTHRLHGDIPEDPTVQNSRTARLTDPDDLYRFTGTGPRDYVADDGRPDMPKISEAVYDLIQRRPELQARPDRVVIPNVSDSPEDRPQRPRFQAAFSPDALERGLT